MLIQVQWVMSENPFAIVDMPAIIEANSPPRYASFPNVH